MITINNLEEMQKYYDKQTNTYIFDDDVKFHINIEVESNIKACDIDADDIDAWDIKAQNIKAWNIKACNIKANDIKAWNIAVLGIDAGDIDYYSVCMAKNSFKCKSVNGYRKNSIHKCLDKEIEYIK